MASSLRVFILLSAALLPLSTLEGKVERGLSLRLVASEIPKGQEKVLIEAGKKKSKPLDLSTDQLSEPVVVADRSMILKAADGEAALCTVTLPEDGKSFAVLLVAKKPAGYTPVVVRTDDRAFKSGDVFFVNQTTKTIVLKLGGTGLVIEPGKSAKASPTKPDNNSYEVVISERGKDGEKLVSSTRWPVDKNLRSYILLTENDSGRTNYHAVDEYLEKGR